MQWILLRFHILIWEPRVPAILTNNEKLPVAFQDGARCRENQIMDVVVSCSHVLYDNLVRPDSLDAPQLRKTW
uniref:Uncharacterized protein n=1 Tax=Arundo donax TaxID=35708 RepID=A0A0A9GQ13_ARUDO